MQVGPARVADPRLVDSLLIAARHLHRDREPLRSLRRLDAVPIAPVASGVLPVVVEDELVDEVDQVEIALPGDVARLDDRHSLPDPRAHSRPPAYAYWGESFRTKRRSPQARNRRSPSYSS